MKQYIFLLALIIGLISCEKLIMKPNAKTDNKAIFEEYAMLVKEKYAMLDFKGVDIDHLIDSIGNTITNDLPEDTLFAKLAIITHRLRDGHSSLIGVYNSGNFNNLALFDLYAGYPIAFNDTILRDNYTSSSIAPNLKRIEVDHGESTIELLYGYLPQSSTIAYIRIPSFNISLEDQQIESIFEEINGASGCILDVRGNGGGDPSLSTTIASYFMEQVTYTGYERFKIGPGPNDFQNSPSYVTPAESEHRFLNPVVILTDRGCYSATTTLAYSMNPLPQVTFMGQRTGGGSGSVADGFLANGWRWSLSTSEFIDHLGNHLDDGFDPDIQVAFDNNDQSQDEILEEALLYLQ